jgi:hypothetical protein
MGEVRAPKIGYEVPLGSTRAIHFDQSKQSVCTFPTIGRRGTAKCPACRHSEAIYNSFSPEYDETKATIHCHFHSSNYVRGIARPSTIEKTLGTK